MKKTDYKNKETLNKIQEMEERKNELIKKEQQTNINLNTLRNNLDSLSQQKIGTQINQNINLPANNNQGSVNTNIINNEPVKKEIKSPKVDFIKNNISNNDNVNRKLSFNQLGNDSVNNSLQNNHLLNNLQIKNDKDATVNTKPNSNIASNPLGNLKNVDIATGSNPFGKPKTEIPVDNLSNNNMLAPNPFNNKAISQKENSIIKETNQQPNQDSILQNNNKLPTFNSFNLNDVKTENKTDLNNQNSTNFTFSKPIVNLTNTDNTNQLNSSSNTLNSNSMTSNSNPNFTLNNNNLLLNNNTNNLNLQLGNNQIGFDSLKTNNVPLKPVFNNTSFGQSAILQNQFNYTQPNISFNSGSFQPQGAKSGPSGFGAIASNTTGFTNTNQNQGFINTNKNKEDDEFTFFGKLTQSLIN